VYDAVIAGGGLAGLTLARQLHREAPGVRVLVAEKRTHPVPEAAFKVGESSVEIGAHYFQVVLGLEPHLREQQLEKLGLRYFFPSGDNCDLVRRVELGPPAFPPVPSFQLDRGRFENALLAMLRADGVEVLDGCAVKQIRLDPADGHELEIETAAGRRTVRARFLVDASGRSGLIRRQLGLTRPVTHVANACWFRVKSRVRVDDWGSDPAWRARVPGDRRWLSTNHLMGRGYWVWLTYDGQPPVVRAGTDEHHDLEVVTERDQRVRHRTGRPRGPAALEEHRALAYGDVAEAVFLGGEFAFRDDRAQPGLDLLGPELLRQLTAPVDDLAEADDGGHLQRAASPADLHGPVGGVDDTPRHPERCEVRDRLQHRRVARRPSHLPASPTTKVCRAAIRCAPSAPAFRAGRSDPSD
jgi:2-polyprenyl-6-methoxyphenol hydroxylase-like FAD-dependent oxidoreductase